MGMSKEELIEAINGTLISNEEKAITADALRNLLTDIVENSGGGGQGGGITLQLSTEINEDGSDMVPALTPEQIAHNKEQIDILKQLHDEGKPTPPMAIEVIRNWDGMTMSEIFMYITTIIWGLTGTEVPEGMLPEGVIFPVVMFMDEFTMNGDGTLIME